jgi:hypothetical protein
MVAEFGMALLETGGSRLDLPKRAGAVIATSPVNGFRPPAKAVLRCLTRRARVCMYHWPNRLAV